MSVPRPTGSAGDNNRGKDKDKDTTVAKTAGFVVFSGIAMSILKALNPYNNNNSSSKESTPPLHESKSPPFQEPTKSSKGVCDGSSSSAQTIEINKNPEVVCNGQSSSAQIIEIVKGDTLWGLSRKYGVPIDAIKEANGITGDTIYAGKKLVIP